MDVTTDTVFPFCWRCNDYHYSGTGCVYNIAAVPRHIVEPSEKWRIMNGKYFRIDPGSPPRER